MVNAILSTDTQEPATDGNAKPLVHHVPTNFSDRFALGYRNIYWFRDGMDTWREKGGKLGPIAPAIAALGSDANNMLSCLAWMQSLTVVGAGKTSNYLPFGKRLMSQLQINIPAHTVAEALSDYMDFQAVDEIEMYSDLLKRNRTEAAAFRKAHLADLDKTCRALPGAPSALFSS